LEISALAPSVEHLVDLVLLGLGRHQRVDAPDQVAVDRCGDVDLLGVGCARRARWQLLELRVLTLLAPSRAPALRQRSAKPPLPRMLGSPSMRTASAVWRSSPELVLALDEHFGPPVDSYVNGSQTWLLDNGPGGVTLEWRFGPVAAPPPPAGGGPPGPPGRQAAPRRRRPRARRP